MDPASKEKYILFAVLLENVIIYIIMSLYIGAVHPKRSKLTRLSTFLDHPYSDTPCDNYNEYPKENIEIPLTLHD